MKEKLKIKAIIIFIPIILIGVTYLVNNYLKKDITSLNNKCVVVSEKVMEGQSIDNKPIQIVQKWESKNIKGLSEILGFVSEDEVLVKIGLTKDEVKKKCKNRNSDSMSIKEFSNIFDKIIGSPYILNLKTLEKSPLNLKKLYLRKERKNGKGPFISGISPDYKKLNCSINEKSFLYDLSSNEITNHSNSMMDCWSENGKYLIQYKIQLNSNYEIRASSNDEIKKIYLYDVEKKSRKEIPIYSETVRIPEMHTKLYSIDGKDVYFIGEENKKGKKTKGIFKINVQTKKIEEVMILPGEIKDNYNKQSIIIDFIRIDNKIIFSGRIQDKSSIYLYDINNKKIVNLIPSIKTKDFKFGDFPMFTISPNKNKIAYINKGKENIKNNKWNLYVARIDHNKLVNKVMLKKNIYIDGRDVPKHKPVKWSCDSKSITYFTYDSEVKINDFYVTEGNNINVIRFK